MVRFLHLPPSLSPYPVYQDRIFATDRSNATVAFLFKAPPMKTFYLQQEKSGRQFIDEVQHEGCEQIKQCDARTWRDAKEKLTAE